MKVTIEKLVKSNIDKKEKLKLLLDLLVFESQNNQHLRDLAYEYGITEMAEAYNGSTNNLKIIKCAIEQLY